MSSSPMTRVGSSPMVYSDAALKKRKTKKVAMKTNPISSGGTGLGFWVSKELPLKVCLSCRLKGFAVVRTRIAHYALGVILIARNPLATGLSISVKLTLLNTASVSFT